MDARIASSAQVAGCTLEELEVLETAIVPRQILKEALARALRWLFRADHLAAPTKRIDYYFQDFRPGHPDSIRIDAAKLW